jgi:hypothetical protein
LQLIIAILARFSPALMLDAEGDESPNLRQIAGDFELGNIMCRSSGIISGANGDLSVRNIFNPRFADCAFCDHLFLLPKLNLPLSGFSAFIGMPIQLAIHLRKGAGRSRVGNT